MLDQQLVNQLADLLGLAGSYVDSSNELATIAVENKVRLLGAMGLDISSNQSVNEAITREQASAWQQVLPKVAVLHQGKPFNLELRLPESALLESIQLVITLENGEKCHVSPGPAELVENARYSIEGLEYVGLVATLPSDLPLGYHQVVMEGFSEPCSLVVVPETCYEPEALAQGKKILGSGIQLYSVRSKENWGMGDYKDLDALIQGLAENGADFIGLNPVHALYPGNPGHCSPYSPSSRTYGNVLYINPEMVPEFSQCQVAVETVNSGVFQSRLQEARSQDYVDYSLVASLKYSVLEQLYDYFCSEHLAKDTGRAQAFLTFCQEGGDSLRRFATFDTLYEHFRKQDIMSWGWPCWPGAYQRPDTPEVAAFVQANEKRVRYYEYLQWLAQEQLATAQQTAKQHGMMLGVYRDLAVGVDRGGADVWSEPSLYCLDAGTGAPPDALGPMGQSWGLPPFNPKSLYAQAYEPFIRLVRSNMNNCGALRIDHAMGLFRLWWYPADQGAMAGAYVHYPLQDLLGIIKLESHRYQCLVFGEDLGVVPDEIKEALPPAKLYSCINGIHVQCGDRYPALDEYKVKAMANLTCHDTPPLKGWWQGKDIEVFGELGIYDEERMTQELEAREHTRKAVINTLSMVNELPHGVDPHGELPEFSRELMEHFNYYLARSVVQVVNIQLEDCMLIDTSVNVPGTSTEYPNWRRRLTENVEDFFAKEDNQRFFHNLAECRKA